MSHQLAIRFVDDLLENFQLKIHYLKEGFVYDQEFHTDVFLMNLLNVSPNSHYIFKELGSHCRENTIYHIDSPLRCNYLLFRMPDTGENPLFAYVGPYSPCLISQKFILEIADRYHISAENIPSLKHFYQNLPWINDENVLMSIFCTLGKHLWGSMDAFSIKRIETSEISDLNLVSEVSNSDTSPSVFEDMHALESRYALESQLSQAVVAGQTHKAEMTLSALTHNQYEERTPNTLRNRKNYLIVLNTVLRIAAVTGAVHPFYVDQISSQYARKIENVSSETSFDSLSREMVRKYCLLVKNHSLKGYTLLIQKVLSNIDLDLTADLSLRAQAELLNVNPSYLSALFKKEVGMTLTDYVNHRRIEHAILLLNSTNMQIQMIAQYCGIPGVNYFTKTFRKIVGKTPSEYRKDILNLV